MMASWPVEKSRWSSILIRGVYEWMEPAWVKISEAGADEKEDRCDAFPEGTGEGGSMATSVVCVGYISWLLGADTAGRKCGYGSYSAERMLGLD